MKIFTSILFLLLVALSTFSLPYPSEKNSSVDENGSGEGSINESSTTEQGELKNDQELNEKTNNFEEIGSNEELMKISSSTTSTSTVAPVPQIIYDLNELIQKVTTRFNELKANFLKNQDDVYDKVQMDLEKYKTLCDTSIKIMKDAYDHEIAESHYRLKSIKAQKKAIEKSIKDIYDNSWNKEENLNKLEKLKKRAKLLNEMKAVNCEDCDGFLDNDQIDTELQKADKKIAQLEEQIQKRENESEIRIRELTSDETHQLNTKYVELIHVYQKEVEERKKMENLNLINSNINDKLKNYAEKVSDLHAKVGTKMEDLTKDSLKLIKLTSIDKSSNNDDLNEFNNKPDKFKWVPHEKFAEIPPDVVLGGEDADGSNLYIIRSKKDDLYLYGKFAVSSGRKDPYVTNSESETIPSSFELLTTKNYTWCDLKTQEKSKNTISVCKTTHFYESGWTSTRKEIVLPGTLLEDGKCRVGFGWKVFTYTENVKVLGFGSCHNTEDLTDVKFWF